MRVECGKKYIDVCTCFYFINQDSSATMKDILDKFDEYRKKLHTILNNKRVNKVNLRKEFF